MDLKVSVNKTKVNTCYVKINEHTVEQVKHFTYLYRMFTNNEKLEGYSM